jgi:hypothetical protein
MPEESSRTRIEAIGNSLCDDLNNLLTNITDNLAKCNQEIITEEVIKGIISDLRDPASSIKYSKAYLDELAEMIESSFLEKEIEAELKFIEENIDKSLIAPACYYEAINLDKSLGIKLMDRYLKSSIVLDKSDRLDPLNYFMSLEKISEVFEDNLPFFIEKVVPVIIKNKLIDEMSEVGIKIVIIILENGLAQNDDYSLEIEFGKGDSAKNYGYDYLKKFIKRSTLIHMSLNYDKNRVITPIGELIQIFNANKPMIIMGY